jgi:hypothetical protein
MKTLIKKIKKNYFGIFLHLIVIIHLIACSPPEKDIKKYNVLFIAVDDLRPDIGA